MAIDRLTSSPWLLLPGTLCKGEVFNGLLDALAVPSANRQPVVLDRPSVESYTDLYSWTSQCTIVCGFSLGTIVAAHLSGWMAALCLVLFGIDPYADDPAKAERRDDLLRDVAAKGGAVAIASRIPALHGTDPDAVRSNILTMADESSGLIDVQTRLALGRPDVLPILSTAQYPVIALSGELDKSTPPRHGQAAADTAPRGHFQCLEGLGHFALLEAPVACANTMMQFEDRKSVAS